MKKYLVLVFALMALGLAPMAASAGTTTTIVKPSEQRVVLQDPKDHQVLKVRHYQHGHGNYYYYSPYGYDYYDYDYNPYGYNYNYYTPSSGLYFGW